MLNHTLIFITGHCETIVHLQHNYIFGHTSQLVSPYSVFSHH